MDNLGAELNRFFDSVDLPTLKQVLQVPVTMPIGSVSLREMEETFAIGHRDMNNLIREVKEGHYFQAAQIGVVDVLRISSVFGVPGAGLAATIAPYVFDFVDAEVQGRGRISVPLFAQHLEHSQSHMGIILNHLHTGRFKEASKLSLMDISEAAIIAGGGPAAVVFRITVVAGFGISENGTLQSFFVELIKFLHSIGQTLESIGPAIDSGVFQVLGPAPVKKYSDGSWDEWSPTQGWIRHQFTRRK